MLAMHGLRKHCGMSLLKLRSRPPLYSLQISHAFSSKPDNNQNNEVKEVTPNLIFYSLYSTLCYCGVYVGTFSSIYMALTKGIITAESFDVDQLESAARLQYILGAKANMADGPHMQQLADAMFINRYMKVPRVLFTAGVCLALSNKFGIDMTKDADAHKKLFIVLFALSFTEFSI